MRKMYLVFTIIFSALFLTACDSFGNPPGVLGISDAYYDNSTGEIVLSYEMEILDVQDGELVTTSDLVFLEARLNGTDEWFEIDNLANLAGKNISVDYAFQQYGNYELRIIIKDDLGNIVEESDVFNINVEFKDIVYHFDTWFDEQLGLVLFNYDIEIDYSQTHIFIIENYVNDEWQEVARFEVSEFVNRNEFRYFEEVEGNHKYRLTVFDLEETLLGQRVSDNSAFVSFSSFDFSNPDVRINHFDFGDDLYQKRIEFFWETQGDFDTVLIEKSNDGGDTWTVLDEVSKFNRWFEYYEQESGSFEFRISLMSGEAVIDQTFGNRTVSFRDNMLIYSVDAWFDEYGQVAYINWNMLVDGDYTFRLERLEENSTTYELVGEFGRYDNYFEESYVDKGRYTYKVSVFENGILVDSLNSQFVDISEPSYIDGYGAYFNEWDASVRIDLYLYEGYIDYFTVERSYDDGLTWEVVIEKEEAKEDNYHYIDIPEYYEGEVMYRVYAFNDDEEEKGFAETGKINIEFNNLVLYGDPRVNNFWVGAEWNSKVQMQFEGVGDFKYFLIEKSDDHGATFTELAKIPRTAQRYNYFEEIPGDYQYRITALSNAGLRLHSIYNEWEIVQVRIRRVVNNFDLNYQWYNPMVDVSWSMFDNDYEKVLLYRSYENDPFELIGEFDNATYSMDDEIPFGGRYRYKLEVIDAEGVMVDFFTGYDFELNIPSYINNFWFDVEMNSKDIELYWDTEGKEYDHATIKLIDSFTNEVLSVTEVGNENDDVMISVLDIGQYRFRIDMFDANNELLGVNTTYDFQIEEPIYLWNAQGWFDAYGAQVYFHFGYWEDSVDSYTIEKSYSAASGWELVQTVTDLTGNGNQYMDLYLPEYTEGNVDYKVTVYDVDGNSLGEMTVDNIEVNFDDREFSGDPYLNQWYVHSNNADNFVEFNFESNGIFDHYLIEESTDNGLTWSTVAEPSKYARSFRYYGEVGVYQFRISTILEDGTVFETQFNEFDFINLRSDRTIIFDGIDYEWNSNKINLKFYNDNDEYDKVMLYKWYEDGTKELLSEFDNTLTKFVDIINESTNHRYYFEIYDVDGTLIDVFATYTNSYNAPDGISRFETYFNLNQGVMIELRVRPRFVDSVTVEQSMDGGLTWTEVATLNPETNDNYEYINLSYFEYVLGTYVYRATSYDVDGNKIDTETSNEVRVADDYYSSGEVNYGMYTWYNVWGKYVDINLNHDGLVYKQVIEVSFDGSEFEVLAEVPGYSNNFNFYPETNGTYTFIIKAYDEDNTLLFESEPSENEIDLTDQISGFNLSNYGDRVYINWDFNNENVAKIRLERREVGTTDFELVSEFGVLKTSYDDIPSSGLYEYRLSLIDENDNIIDDRVSDQVSFNVY